MKQKIKYADWEKEESRMVKLIVFAISISVSLLVIIVGLCFLYSCTLSFQNISTHGTATDLVDETQSNQPTINPNIQTSLTP